MPKFAALRCLIPLGVLALSSAGCLTPYCFPKFERISSIHLDADGDVYAFRVDVTRRPYRFLLYCTETEEECLQELDLSNNHAVPAQVQLSLSRGLGLIGRVLADDGAHVRHDLIVKLYRPGYEVVVVAPGTKPEHIVWKPLKDRETMVRQLDDLCVHAKPGSVAPEHREALLFIASEYERLAKLEGAESSLGQHMREKVTALRELAGL